MVLDKKREKNIWARNDDIHTFDYESLPLPSFVIQPTGNEWKNVSDRHEREICSIKKNKLSPTDDDPVPFSRNNLRRRPLFKSEMKRRIGIALSVDFTGSPSNVVSGLRLDGGIPSYWLTWGADIRGDLWETVDSTHW